MSDKRLRSHLIHEIDDELLHQISSLTLMNTELTGYQYLDTSVLHKHNIDMICKIAKSNSAFLMAVVDTNASILGLCTLKYQEFDSVMLKMKVYQLIDIGFKHDYEGIELVLNFLLDSLKELLNNQKIDYLFYSSDMNNVNTPLVINRLIEKGFYYLNTLLKFSVESRRKEQYDHLYECVRNAPVYIREANESDLSSISHLARKSYKIDRFHLDTNLPNELCDNLFEKSTENSLLEKRADILLVAEHDKKVVGYLSARRNYFDNLDSYIGEGMISAVDPSFRGLGIFTHLSNRMWIWFLENTLVGESGTYINNIAVHRAWTNNALSLVRSYHQLAFFNRRCTTENRTGCES